jgi:RNA polymerase sigma-70 factor (ECF subfamily)
MMPEQGAKALTPLGERPGPDFETFCNQRFKELQIFVRAHCADRGIADEIVQETFVAAMGAWERISQYTKPMGWLIKTARSKLRRTLRQAAAQNERTSSLDIMIVEPYREPVNDAEAEIVLLQLLARLRRREREVFVLDLLRFTIQEIAQLLDLPPTTVRDYRESARQRLQALINEDTATQGGV